MRKLIARAQDAFKAGKYARAISLYSAAAAAEPELAETYRFWQELARKRLGSLGMGTSALDPDKNSYAESSYLSLSDLWAQAAEAASARGATNGGMPLVSVLMTAHNMADYIDSAVTSVLRQTWGNLELVVVDDASTDETPSILNRLMESDGRIRLARLNSNLGTYFAKNLALTMAQGDFIFFQDGDDLCHPERIRLMMDELQRPGVVCVQGAYSRVQYPGGRVLPINNVAVKLGLITLGLKRQVFDEVGFFNCTTKASDDEFFNRLLKTYGGAPGSIATLDLPLYYNTFREGSLFRDMVGNDVLHDGRIEQVPSPSRADYVKVFSAFHKNTTREKLKKAFSFPVLRDVLPVAADMTKLSNPDCPVVVALCSIPERVEQLQTTLVSLAPQADFIHLYLDRYEQVPSFLEGLHPQLMVWRSQEYPGLRDNAKLLPLATLKEPCYYLTCDDDIVYPPDYVHCMVKKLGFYRKQVVLGVHGVLLPEHPTGYFSGFRKVFNFLHPLECDQLVNILGTGTVAFHTSVCDGLDYRKFTTSGMLDLWFASWCKDQGIPMVAIARHAGWLQELECDAPSLFNQYLMADQAQTELVCSNAPWGYAAIEEAIAAAADKLPEEQSELVGLLKSMVPLLRDGLR